ncbi:MAG TPA: hypothetical protein VM577_21195 [Anaerovoracaceae bacterium]|nr:hypothetical protein [Anaerovoracaceae bacterium]
MKLPANNISTESSKALAEQAFGIGNIGLIFDILRSKVYKNPIVAIAREISCNARDAHREVGKPDRPIEIQLPNSFAPEYKIRDFGPGISPDRMSNVFIQYATSTKRDDNLQTGGFGLGAKTPFSYTDSFSISTIVDGVKRVYNAYIDETLIGKMVLVNEQPTDEANGTTIIVPVAKKDFKEFIDATVAVTEYWDVKPILTGCVPAPAYKNNKVLYSGNKWSLASRGVSQNQYGYGYTSSSIAIIDGIGYPIESTSISNISNHYKNLLSNPFHFHFGNGELSLSASRDSIHYDEKTQRVLVQRISAMSKEVIEIINNKIQSCSSYQEACGLYKQTLQEFNNPSELQTQLRSAKLWKGFKLILDPQPGDVGRYAKLTTYVRRSDNKIKTAYASAINYQVGDVLFHNDKTQEDIPKKLINYYFSINTHCQRLQVVSTPEEPTSSEYISLVKQNKTPVVEYDMDFLKILGAQPLSTIVIPKVVKPRKPRAKNKTTISAYEISNVNDRLHCRVIEVDNDGGVYIKVNYKDKLYTSEAAGQPIFSLKANTKISLIEKFLGKPIYGFSETRIPKLSKDWVPLQTAIANRIKELESEVTKDKIVEDCDASHWLFQYVFDNESQLKKFFKDIKIQDGLFMNYIKESQAVEERINKYRPYIYVLQLTQNIEGPVYDKYRRRTTADNTKLYKLQNAITKRYPLLMLLDDRYQDDDLKHVIDYINLVDESHASKVTQLKKTA